MEYGEGCRLGVLGGGGLRITGVDHDVTGLFIASFSLVKNMKSTQKCRPTTQTQRG